VVRRVGRFGAWIMAPGGGSNCITEEALEERACGPLASSASLVRGTRPSKTAAAWGGDLRRRAYVGKRPLSARVGSI
jgi:hypothetical protein